MCYGAWKPLLDASTRSLAVKLLLDLLKAYSPTFSEDKAVGVLYDYAHKLNYDSVEIDSVGNLIARIGRGRRRILMISHVDTVEGYIQPGFDGHSFYGRGAVDAKGPLAAMVVAASLAQRYVDTDDVSIHVVAAVGEEGPSHGARHLVDAGTKYDSAIVGEPTSMVNVVVGCRGSCRVVVTCRGSGGHASSPWLYSSACEKLMEAWTKIRQLLGGVSASEFSASLVKMTCGEGPNTIPRRGEAVINVRVPIGRSTADVRSALTSIGLNEECNVSIEDCTEPVRVPVNSLSVRALNRALIRLGFKPRIAIKLGTSDMNLLYGRITADIVEWGPGRSELSHTDREEITVEEYFTGIEVYRRALVELYSLYRAKRQT
jgi:LysW-gamma-L-lysine carboxypeptidase